ncbi:MAG: ROK family protein [Planctomycetaceae bacterium]|nr:ROK family protein [Planctomycetaceae bacterium]
MPEAMNPSPDRVYIGFDLGGTKMMAAVFDAEFNILSRRRRKTRGNEGQKAGLERIGETIDLALEEAKVTHDRLAAIGVGCPGPLDLDKGIIFDAPNLGWKNVAIREFLEKRYNSPARIANDVDAGVYGEYSFGAGKGARCVLGVFPGTGIGGGCVYEGKIIRGTKSSCMEIGHVQVLRDGPRCGCGLRGCVEGVASRLAISAAAAAAVYRGQAPKLAALVGTDLKEIRSSALAEAIKEGDTVIEEIIKDACKHIGVAVGAVIHLLSPDVIVLGGGLVEAMPKLFVGEVKDAARKNVMDTYRDTFKVVAAKLGDDATALGAAAWAVASLQPA